MAIWVFGYGSLMWDEWECAHECSRRVVADLPGFRRTFNKASIQRWGTKKSPCPTLSLLVASESSCHGIAFKFHSTKENSLRIYLQEREGRGFHLREHRVRVSEKEIVTALVPMYEGNNLVHASSAAETAEMVCRATGSAGKCIDYVKSISDKLRKGRQIFGDSSRKVIN